MPTTTPVFLLPGTLPYTCYPTLPQTLNNDIVTRIQAFLNETFPGIYVGDNSNPPPASMRDRIWVNTSTPWWYQWTQGDWKRVYQFPAVGDPSLPSIEFIWSGTEAALQDYGLAPGGGAGPADISTGPLWAIDHEIDGRTIVGVGEIPTSDPAVTLAQGDTGGVYDHALTKEEGAVSDHVHPTGVCDAASDDAVFPIVNVNNVPAWTGHYVVGGGAQNNPPESTANLYSLKAGLDGAGVEADPHPNMQPYIARYVIRRTARVWVPAPY